MSTYNEPLITSEWAVAIFKEARARGLMTAYVSNGNGTPEVLDYIRPWIDLYKVDLKSFDDRHYRQLGGRIEPILATIRALHGMGLWLEIVTLLIPGFNDSPEEIDELTTFVASVSPDIPWHVTAFHKDYRMTDPANTTAAMLVAAAETGRRNGLRFVYAGNLPGQVGDSRTRGVTRAARCWSSAWGITSCSTVSRRRGVALTAARRSRADGERATRDRSPTHPFCQGAGVCGPTDSRAGSGANRSLS